MDVLSKPTAVLGDDQDRNQGVFYDIDDRIGDNQCANQDVVLDIGDLNIGALISSENRAAVMSREKRKHDLTCGETGIDVEGLLHGEDVADPRKKLSLHGEDVADPRKKLSFEEGEEMMTEKETQGVEETAEVDDNDEDSDDDEVQICGAGGMCVGEAEGDDDEERIYCQFKPCQAFVHMKCALSSQANEQMKAKGCTVEPTGDAPAYVCHLHANIMEYKPIEKDMDFVSSVIEKSVIAGEDIPWTEAARTYANLHRKMLAFKRVFLQKWNAMSPRKPFTLRKNQTRWIMATLLVMLRRFGIEASAKETRAFIYKPGDFGNIPFVSYFIKEGRGSWVNRHEKDKRPVPLAASREEVYSHVKGGIQPQRFIAELKDTYTYMGMFAAENLSNSDLKLHWRISRVIIDEQAAPFLRSVYGIILEHFYACGLDQDMKSDKKLLDFMITAQLGRTVTMCLRLLLFDDASRQWDAAVQSKAPRPQINSVLRFFVTMTTQKLADAVLALVSALHVSKTSAGGGGTEISFTAAQLSLYAYKCGWILNTADHFHSRHNLDDETLTCIRAVCSSLKLQRANATKDEVDHADMKARIDGTSTFAHPAFVSVMVHVQRQCITFFNSSQRLLTDDSKYIDSMVSFAKTSLTSPVGESLVTCARIAAGGNEVSDETWESFIHRALLKWSNSFTAGAVQLYNDKTRQGKRSAFGSTLNKIALKVETACALKEDRMKKAMKRRAEEGKNGASKGSTSVKRRPLAVRN